MQLLFKKYFFDRFCIMIYLYCSICHILRVQVPVLQQTALHEYQAPKIFGFWPSFNAVRSSTDCRIYRWVSRTTLQNTNAFLIRDRYVSKFITIVSVVFLKSQAIDASWNARPFHFSSSGKSSILGSIPRLHSLYISNCRSVVRKFLNCKKLPY